MIGELAEHVLQTEGKTTRLYTGDKGGTDTIQPYIDLGVIKCYEMANSNPWLFLHHAVRGHGKDAAGKWIVDDISNVGLFAFEGLTSFAEAFMQDLAKSAAAGINIGGGSNINFSATENGETIKIGGNNPAHYGLTQNRMVEEITESQKLPCSYILWTASVSKDDDSTAVGKVLGPAMVGKAWTSEIPRLFPLSFRMDAIAAQQGKSERHLLYMGNHVDVGAGNAVGLGNTRLPMDASPLKETIIEPASIVKALQLLDGGYNSAKETISKRLGDKLSKAVK